MVSGILVESPMPHGGMVGLVKCSLGDDGGVRYAECLVVGY